ncbi:putative nucleoside triphosphate pyrophosphohydrolase [Pectobacterium phage vB_PatP_CB3]|uniref:Putative nucleoside triphosphate pyrophosphohydrolase n=2 Tax=Cbunavirus TaxID=2842586 RepID=A0A2P0PAT2_9CAUD|nr:MazG-like pyrophosphatase [Pectobacterium phage vB_PatP_CB1]ARB11814.1 putative nucleoside triphosphate pyrophosphohydrolase [Pectobacterium phage vB_PatP_CB1]ARB11916.1 putative nucleoside triphosphate pyrophosphohydrolase [Pectobacterium phage vB_PatP_CB3]
MKTTFEKVTALNLAFGNAKGDLNNPDVKAIRKQAMLCLEEAIEMVEAAHPGIKVHWEVTGDANNTGVDILSLLDAQGDLTTVNDGVGHVAGFDGNAVYQLVHDSNMSKFISQEEDKVKALSYYYDLGFQPDDLYLHGDYPTMCIKVKRDIKLNGKFYPEGKFLKNMVTFKEPDFSVLLPYLG